MNGRKSARRLAAIVALGAVLQSSPASGATDSHADPARDVVLDSGSGIKETPANRSSDITRFTVAHSAKKVSVTMRLRDLKDNEPFAVLQIKAAGAAERFTVAWLRDRYQNEPASEYLAMVHGNEVVRCASLRARVSFVKDRLTISMAPSCLHSPRWVKVGGLMGTNGPDGSGYLDFSHRKGGASLEAVETGGIPLGNAVTRR